jgi:hypothetical protein
MNLFDLGVWCCVYGADAFGYHVLAVGAAVHGVGSEVACGGAIGGGPFSGVWFGAGYGTVVVLLITEGASSDVGAKERVLPAAFDGVKGRVEVDSW